MTWQTFNLVLRNKHRRGQWIGNNKLFESQQQQEGVQILDDNALTQIYVSLRKDSSIKKKKRKKF